MHSYSSAESRCCLSDVTIVSEERAVSFLASVMVYDVCSFERWRIIGRVVSENERFGTCVFVVYCQLEFVRGISYFDVSIDDGLQSFFFLSVWLRHLILVVELMNGRGVGRCSILWVRCPLSIKVGRDGAVCGSVDQGDGVAVVG